MQAPRESPTCETAVDEKREREKGKERQGACGRLVLGEVHFGKEMAFGKHSRI